MWFWVWILRGLIALLGIGLFLLQSQVAKKSILEFLVNQPFEDSSFHVEAEDVRGLFPFQFTVASLAIKDEKNHTLAALRDIRAEWLVSALLNKKIRYDLRRGEELYGELDYLIGNHGLYVKLEGTGVALRNKAYLKSVIVDLPTLNLLKGQVRVVFFDGQSPATLSMQLVEPYLKCLKLYNIRLKGENGEGIGEATFYNQQQTWEGQANLLIPNLGVWSHWFDKKIAGSGHVSADKKTTGVTEFKASMDYLEYGSFKAAALLVQGRGGESVQKSGANPSSAAPQAAHNLTIHMQADKISANGLAFPKVSGQAALNHNEGKFTLSGGEDKNISFRSEGNIYFPDDKNTQTRIILKQADLRHPLHRLSLKSPASIIWGDNGIQTSGILLRTGDGSIAFENVKLADELAGNVKINQLPLTLLRIINPDWIATGTLSGKGALSGNSNKPEANLFLEGKSLHWKGTTVRHKSLPGVNLSGTLSLKDSLATWHVKASCKNRVNLDFDGKYSTDKDLPPSQNSGEAVLKGQGDLQVISLFLDSEDLIHGQASVNLDARGTLNNPMIKGYFSIKNGTYENAAFGTLVKNIRLDATAAQNSVTFSLNGQDATTGTLFGKGAIHFPSLFNPSLNLKIKFDQMMILQNDEINAKASGKVTIKGVPGGFADDKAKISGDVALQPLEVRLDHHASKLATIKLLEKKENGAYETLAEHERQELKKQGLGLFDLDVHITSKKHIYLRGYGLDSQWKGDVKVLGTETELRLDGKITLIKGKFDLLGRHLALNKGLISFSNDVKNDPLLNIIGGREIGDTTAMMRVEGRASSPQITFFSNPALPQEEVLARLIFDKGLESISVTQTLLLANAITSFKSNNKLNFADKIRSAFGLDILEFKEKKPAEGDEYQSGSQMVSVGKRISDKFYLSLDQSVTGDGGPTATVQYDLTRNFKIEAGVGGDQNTALGFSWIKRY
jgi:autotransporter translocation and assembly factor TamB